MKTLTKTLLFCLFATFLKGQDNHFSMFYNSPLTLNPALTGLMVEDIRVAAQYRSQWQSVTVPYQTMMLSADMNLFKNSLQNDFVGAGLVLFNDKAGDSEFRNTQIQLSASYNKSLSGQADQYLSAGFQVGLGQQALNFGNLLFDSQYDGSILDPNIPSGEALIRQNVMFLDMSAGLAWFYVPSEKTSFYVGAAVAHFNRPNMSFIEGAENPLLPRWTLHAGVEFPVTGGLSIVPRGVVLIQGPHTEINVGGLLKFRVNPELGDDYGQTAFYLGTMHRFGDAQVIIARFDYKRFGLSVSYDINISSLDVASRSNGGIEIGLTYRDWFYDAPANTGPVGCPTF